MKIFLPILFFTLFAAFCSNAQESRGISPEQLGKTVKVYPNPATSYVTIDLQGSYQKGLTIVVYNFLGKKMYELPNVSEKTTITLADYNRGVYIYHLTDQAGKIIDTGKFQVSR